MAGVLIPADVPEVARKREARSGVARIAPFLLLGFAWFFLTVGTVELFVVERERRTLELLLSVPVDRVSLAWGKTAYVLLQAAGPQLAAAAAFLAVGFSPWILSLTLLTLVALVPASVLAFWYFRDMDSSVSAGWRNGLLFILGFPLIILTDNVAGRLSPIYHLAKALEGPPPAPYYGTCLLAVGVLVLASILWLPRVARRWGP